MNTSTKTLQHEILDDHKPTTTHISYKQHEKNLLVMEQKLMRHYCMNRSDLHKHFIRNAYNTLGHLFNKMDKATREKKELLINHLVTERNKIEDACGGKPRDDIKKVYNHISRTIAELKMEVFMMDYSDYEENLNELLGIGRSSK